MKKIIKKEKFLNQSSNKNNNNKKIGRENKIYVKKRRKIND